MNSMDGLGLFVKYRKKTDPKISGEYITMLREDDAEPMGRVLIHSLVKDLKAAALITLNEKLNLDSKA